MKTDELLSFNWKQESKVFSFFLLLSSGAGGECFIIRGKTRLILREEGAVIRFT